MRGLLNRAGRGVVAAAVVVMLAAPAVEAKPTDSGWTPSRLLKAVKRYVVSTFGDGLIIPRP